MIVSKQGVDDSVFYYALNENLASNLWKKLDDLYEKKIVDNETFIIRELVNLKFK